MMMIHRQFDEELTTLRKLLLQMGDVVDEQIADAVTAVSRCDVAMAERVHRRDDEVDALELEVDYECVRLLALQTPVASDLRRIITASRMNADLERVGDHAKNIAKATPYMVECPDLINQTRIQEMADLARTILHEAQDAFIRRDRVLARQVLAHDRQVDRLYEETFTTLSDLFRQYPQYSEALSHMVMVSKDIERIADHAKGIAESVIFLIEGSDVRHPKLPRPEQPFDRG